jgi:PTS system glucitol/sorbitol-specific IIA component
MTVLFEATVSKVGELVADFAAQQMLILFDEIAPEELHDVTVLLTKRRSIAEITVGDLLVISGIQYPITFVGRTANQSLNELGHITLKFNSGSEDLPGTICVEKAVVPPIQVGTVIQMIRM